MIDVATAIRERRSIRAFLPTPVPRETIEAILALAARAPSGSNIQPWKVRVLMGEAVRHLGQDLSRRHEAGDEGDWEYKYYPVAWREPYLARRRATGFGLYRLVGIPKGDVEAMRRQHRRNFVFFDAPVGLIFTIDRDMEQGSWLDYGMFLQSVMLAAKGFGLDTCPQAAFCQYHALIGQRLGLPPSEMIVCGMSLGHADPHAPENRLVTDRSALSEFVTVLDRLPDSEHGSPG
jgi:nitroreductase